MNTRLLICLFVFAMAAAFGQDAVPVKAGDRAPEIDWTKVVRSPESAQYRLNLAGRYTVLQFLPNVTANAQAIGLWNDLIAKFTDQPVQFVWIAAERWSAVEPFLRKLPMNGWLLIDDKSEAARAYGCGMGGTAIVDPSGKIAGFSLFLQPELLQDVLDGKARLDSEPHQFRPLPTSAKPDIPPSYEVHISPSKANGTDGSSGPDFWVRRGFDLKSVVSEVYEKDLSRVVLPSALDNDDKFDFVIVLPNPEHENTIHQLVQRAIEKRFKVAAVVENKPAEVYVMTAIKGRTPPAKTGPESLGGGFTSSSSFEFLLPEATEHSSRTMGISEISAGNTTIDDFRKDLERGLERPILDETGLEGVYDLAVHGDAKNTAQFIQMLREQTGLVLTTATRSIEFLTLRSLH